MSLLTDLQVEIDEVAGPTFYVIDQVYDALNASMLEIWSNLKEWQRTSASISLTTGDNIISLPTTSVMIPQFVIYNGVKIFPTTHAMLQDVENDLEHAGDDRRATWRANHHEQLAVLFYNGR